MMPSNLIAALIPLFLAFGRSSGVLPPDAHTVARTALQAMYHATRDTAVQAIRVSGIEHTWVLGNAERAEGPWRVAYAQIAELYDPANGRLRRAERAIRADGGAAPERVTLLTDSVAVALVNGRYAGGSHGTYEDIIDRVDGMPLRALRLADESPHLALEAPVDRFGVPHDVIAFPWRNGRMRIEISRDSHLPTAVDIVRGYPDNFRWAPFGDVDMRTENVDWTITPSGMYWPMQQKVSLNGQPLRDVTYALALSSPSAAPDSFVVADDMRAQFDSASRFNFSRFRLGMRGPPTELAPGIVRVPDFWSQTLVKQPDGVVIFEAHISADYLHEVIAEARRRWPSAPIKALVMTSDPWAHLGGVREAMALNIPIYVHANSVPFLRRLAASPHSMPSDALAKSRRAPRLIPVRSKTALGSGENRIELYPVGGPYAERMLMAYFPERRLLYGADLVFMNRGPDGAPAPGFTETEAADLRAAVARERLRVDTLFCVQNYGPFAWRDFARETRG